MDEKSIEEENVEDKERRTDNISDEMIEYMLALRRLNKVSIINIYI
jgi:hypothetical protein